MPSVPSVLTLPYLSVQAIQRRASFELWVAATSTPAGCCLRPESYLRDSGRDNRTSTTVSSRLYSVPIINLGNHALNTFRPEQNGQHFANTIFKNIFLIWLKFVSECPVSICLPALVLVIDWHSIVKATSYYLKQLCQLASISHNELITHYRHPLGHIP